MVYRRSRVEEFRLLLQADEAFQEADVAFCSEPAIACVAMHGAGKPVVGSDTQWVLCLTLFEDEKLIKMAMKSHGVEGFSLSNGR